MGSEHDAMMVVRAELCERLVSLRTLAGSKRGGNVGESIEGIRRLAAAYGMNPVVRLVMAIAARHGRAGPVVAAAALAALLNSLLAAAGGVLVHDFVTIRALSLLVALALLFAAAAPLLRWRVKVQDGAVTGGLFLGT